MNANATASPANDNAALPAASFDTLADRRAWLAGLKMPKNDSDIEPVLACPTLARLKKSKDRRAATLLAYAAAQAPTHIPASLDAANDNGPTYDGWELSDWHQAEEADVLDVERNREVRPTLNETIQATSSALTVRVSITTTHRSKGWSQPIAVHHKAPPKFDGDFATLGGLKFYRGELRRYESRGREWKPRDDLRGGKGGSKPTRSDANIWRYLSRPGAPWPEQWRTHDGGRTYERSAPTQAAHLQLVSLGVDGSVPTADLPVKATVLPIGLATGAHWLAGVVASTGRSGGSLDASAVEAEIMRTGSAARLRKRLGTDATLLDMAATHMTAEEIGMEYGYRGKYAQRWAVSAIDKAIDKIAA